MMAANLLLSGALRAPEPIESLPERGLFSRRPRAGRSEAQA